MASIKIGEPFGQKERLTDRIKDILKRYSGQHCLFKEFIQNADDAGATEIAFILDSRQLGTNKTFSKEFNKVQGPSLLCWNNAVFTESDLEGITSLGVGSKRDETAKIGRFGVGFNSVYHFTDAPQILSGNSNYVIFDPLCEHIPGLKSTDPGLRIKDVSSVFYQNDGAYADVASGFQVPGFDLNNSTMFRISLRKIPSIICSKTHSIKEIRDLMESFIKFNDAFLVFLKNVNKVSFYEYSNCLTLIGERSIAFSSPYEKSKRDNFRNQMNLIISTNDSLNPTTPKQSICYSITVNQSPENKKSDLVVLEQFGFDKNGLIDELIKNSRSQKEKCFPLGGIFLNLDYFRDSKPSSNNSKLFSFLPLDQNSPLVPNINAYWSLHQENRQRIYEYSMRTENVDKETAKWCTDWNICLINCIILPLFIQLLEHLKRNYTFLNIPMSQFINRYLNMFPKLSENELKPYFEQMVKSFYQQVYELELIPVLNRNNNLQWFKPSQLLFTKDLDYFLYSNKYNDFEASIYEIIETIGINLCRENFLIDLFKHSSIDLSTLQPNHITYRLIAVSSQLVNKRVDQSLLKSIENVFVLLEYINNSPVNSLSNLEKVPLLVKQNIVVSTFSPSSKLIIHDEPELFPDHSALFLNSRFYSYFILKPNYINYFRKIQIQDLATLLPSILNPNVYLNQRKSVKFCDSDIDAYSKAWKLISQSFEAYGTFNLNFRHFLLPISGWSLIPVTQGSETILAAIKDAECILTQSSVFNFNILQPLQLQILNKTTIPSNLSTGMIFENTVLNLNSIEDFLGFLDKLNQRNGLISDDRNHRLQIFRYLTTFVYKDRYCHQKRFRLSRQDAISDMEIRRILKSLPIYQDIYERIDALTNCKANCIDIQTLPEIIRVNLFDIGNDSSLYEDICDFVNHTNLFIINKSSNPHFLEYLEIPEIGIDGFYEIFFKYVKTRNTFSLKNILKDHVFFTQYIQNISNRLLNTLKDLAFIEVDGNFYKVSEFYDHMDPILEIVHGEKLIPEYYRTQEWREHLIRLGLNVKSKPSDCFAAFKKLFTLKFGIKKRLTICRHLIKKLFTFKTK